MYTSIHTYTCCRVLCYIQLYRWDIVVTLRERERRREGEEARVQPHNLAFSSLRNTSALIFTWPGRDSCEDPQTHRTAEPYHKRPGENMTCRPSSVSVCATRESFRLDRGVRAGCSRKRLFPQTPCSYRSNLKATPLPEALS